MTRSHFLTGQRNNKEKGEKLPFFSQIEIKIDKVEPKSGLMILCASREEKLRMKEAPWRKGEKETTVAPLLPKGGGGKISRLPLPKNV